jgi:DNA-binding MarR family transcriptional regulator
VRIWTERLPMKKPNKVVEDTGIRESMLRANSLTSAWRLNYIANFYTVPFYLALERTIGITRAEYVILFCVAQNHGITAQDIVAASGRPKNSLSMAVAKLERKRLIERKRNALDARHVELRPTAKGTAIYRKILPLLQERERRMLAPLTAAERRTFDALLIKVARGVPDWQEADLARLAR